VQVFIFPGTAAQAAVACVLALMSLVAVAKLDPLADATDAMLYMTGCIIIFLSMFMSLLIRGEQSVHQSHCYGNTTYDRRAAIVQQCML
jgi:hypothetical protein